MDAIRLFVGCDIYAGCWYVMAVYSDHSGEYYHERIAVFSRRDHAELFARS
jgi:hypothetical protein